MDTSCCTPSFAASLTATLDIILVEESFLVHLSSTYQDPADSEMCKFTQLDKSSDNYFSIIHKFSVALLARQVHLDALLQLVIP